MSKYIIFIAICNQTNFENLISCSLKVAKIYCLIMFVIKKLSFLKTNALIFKQYFSHYTNDYIIVIARTLRNTPQSLIMR